MMISDLYNIVDVLKTDFSGPFQECIVSNSFKDCMMQFDALSSSFAICVAFAVYSLVWSILGSNVSKVSFFEVYRLVECVVVSLISVNELG